MEEEGLRTRRMYSRRILGAWTRSRVALQLALRGRTTGSTDRLSLHLSRILPLSGWGQTTTTLRHYSCDVQFDEREVDSQRT